KNRRTKPDSPRKLKRGATGSTAACQRSATGGMVSGEELDIAAPGEGHARTMAVMPDQIAQPPHDDIARHIEHESVRQIDLLLEDEHGALARKIADGAGNLGAGGGEKVRMPHDRPA